IAETSKGGEEPGPLCLFLVFLRLESAVLLRRNDCRHRQPALLNDNPRFTAGNPVDDLTEILFRVGQFHNGFSRCRCLCHRSLLSNSYTTNRTSLVQIWSILSCSGQIGSGV